MATLTGNSVSRDARLQQLYLDRLEQRYQRRIAREINRAMKDGAKQITSGGVASYALPEHRQRISAIMHDLWNESGRVFVEHVLGAEKSACAPMTTKRARFHVPATAIMDTVVRDWIRGYGGLKITQISDTTFRDINAVVQQGVMDGLSEREIGKLISRVAPTKSASRSQTIARTEAHTAAMAAAQMAAEATGVEMTREWVASEGDRTRTIADGAQFDHVAANGQRVGMNEPFIIQGAERDEELMHPGDPNGSPANVINCRCSVVFVLP